MGELAELAVLWDACPSYAPAATPEGLADPDDVSPRYAQMSELSRLARHLVELAEGGSVDELVSVFEALEGLLAEGSPEAVTLVRTNLVEELQNITSHRDVAVAPGQLRGLMGPTAGAVWDELEESWAAAAIRARQHPPRPLVEDYLGLDPVDRHKVQAMTRELPDGTLARPSDVLRYEAVRYDGELEERASRIRRRILVVVVLVLLILALGVIVAS